MVETFTLICNQNYPWNESEIYESPTPKAKLLFNKLWFDSIMLIIYSVSKVWISQIIHNTQASIIGA